MHRPDHDSAVTVRPATSAAGTPGWFQDGNPAEGIRGSVVQAEFLNDLLANCLAVCAAGGVTPVKGQDNNLRDAILAMIGVNTVPVGSIVSFAAANAPAGWLIANGAQLSRTTFPALWAHAQASGAIVSDATWLAGRPGAWSTGDGSTTFRIPDMRGLFMRAFHGGSGSYDSDTATTIGQYRDSQNKAHTHNIKMDGSTYAPGTSPTAAAQEFAGTTTYADRILSSGGAESYPRHVSTVFCVKY